jgi:hypothetical protein
MHQCIQTCNKHDPAKPHLPLCILDHNMQVPGLEGDADALLGHVLGVDVHHHLVLDLVVLVPAGERGRQLGRVIQITSITS